MIAYITQQGAKIGREGRRLLVRTENSIHTLFCWKLEQILVFGNVTFTQPALALIFQEKIDLAYFRMDGRYVGRLAQEEAKNIFLRKKQFLLSDDSDFCLNVARSIVQGKLLNQATFLGRIKRSRKKEELTHTVTQLRKSAFEASQCDNIRVLRGIEGNGAAQYFQALSFGFIHDWGFNKRVRRPPTDPVNAVLSLCYTLLINRMYAAVRQAHLDPYPGVLHSLEYGRHSLILDLVEEFRPLIVDTFVLSLFNLKVLDWNDFETPEQEKPESKDPLEQALQDPIAQMTNIDSNITDIHGEQIPTFEFRPSKRPIILTPAAFRRVLDAFSRKLETRFFNPIEEKEMTFSDALTSQARQYRKVIEGEKTEYKPLLLR